MSLVTIDVRSESSVAVVTMNHGENAFSPELLEAMLGALDRIEADESVRAFVLTGADPKFFSTGLDLAWLTAHRDDAAALKRYLDTVNELYARLTVFPKPTVGALNGHTFAAGLFLAAHLDFRFMRKDRGWVCLPEVDINIPLLPGMIAICQAVMPPRGFRQLYYTGERFGGAQAMELGFVDRVCSADTLLDEAVEFAAQLGKKKTKTYAEMKRRIRQPVLDLLRNEDPKHYFSTLAFAK